MNFQDLSADFKKLSYRKQQELISLLSKQVIDSRPILNHKETPTECPHCGCKKLYKHGKYINGGSRFKCRDCNKTFNELTGTSIHNIQKTEEFREFIEQMFEGNSIRQISKEVGVCMKTVFDWRHKVLSSFSKIFTKKFKGIVETDDVFYRFNQKGRVNDFKKLPKRTQGVNNKHQVSVMFSLDRYKTVDLKLVSLGKITTENLYREMDLSKFGDENIIVSDKSRALVKFFDVLGFDHVTFKSKEKVHPIDRQFHVNNLNNFAGRLKRWIKENFSSVSTKYLQNYLNYFLMLEILKDDSNMKDKWWNFMLSDNETFGRNRKSEEEYQEFLSY
ncbi:IS1595 family transposase [Rasiella sp. SM2506]|uniref:IS1595 family transposase n=1 Tax=Rasiella sp. SM2506 TaxID=3423914 RepID=UPI003D79C466